MSSSNRPIDSNDRFCWSSFLQTHALQAAPAYDVQCFPQLLLGILELSQQHPPRFCLAHPPLFTSVILKAPGEPGFLLRLLPVLQKRTVTRELCPREPELLTLLGVFSRPGVVLSHNLSLHTISPHTSRLRDQPIKAKLSSSSLFITTYL